MKYYFHSQRVNRCAQMVAGLLLIALVITHTIAGLQLVTYEAPDFRTRKPIAVYPGWKVANGQATVVNDEAFEGAQSLMLHKGAAKSVLVSRDLTIAAGENVAFIDFRIKPAAIPAQGATSTVIVNGSHLSFVKDAESGLGILHALDGDDNREEAEEWVDSSHRLALVDSKGHACRDWIRISIRQDYTEKEWDLYVNGQLYVAGLGFYQRGETLDKIDFYGSQVADLYLDNLQSDEANILFADADKDGIADDYEADNGMNPLLNDRRVLNADGKTNLAAYLESIWPAYDFDGDTLSNGEEEALGTNNQSPDSDGDGLSDAYELFLGLDPNQPDLNIQGIQTTNNPETGSGQTGNNPWAEQQLPPGWRHRQGPPGSDTLLGGTGQDTLLGEFGDDFLYGGAGDDILEGGEGADRLYGQGDNDILLGGPGADLLYGGDGNDLYLWSWGDGADYIDDSSGQNILLLGEGITPEMTTQEHDDVQGTNYTTTWKSDPNGSDLRVEHTHPDNALLSGSVVIENWESYSGIWQILYAGDDFDEDGLNNLDELGAGTDLTKPDTDGDGLADGWEVAHGYDPTKADSDGDGINDGDEDLDGDGLSNLDEIANGSDHTNADTDGDGLADGWEVAHGYDPTKADSDGDGINDGDEDADIDGLTTLQEIAAGSDHTNADTDGDGLADGWEVAHGYEPTKADSDNNGTNDGDEDLDGDSLSNVDEITHGTDANKADTDGDGLPDGWELQYAFDPALDPALADSDGNGTIDAQEDADNDGYTNIQEYQDNTDPLDPNDPEVSVDTDGDSLPDAWEIANGYDPTKADTDGNGTDDGDEDLDGDGLTNSQEAALGTDPNNSDSDGDGYNDLEELYALNTDPTVPTAPFTYVDESLDSDGDGLANYLERMIGTDPLTPGDVWEEPEPQDIDSDGDGLKDSEETTTDPSLYDTDGDGYGDGWELSYNMDPLDPMDVYDALDFWTLPEAYRLATGLDDWGDEDGDYLSNAEEFWEGTDPLLWDTDGDGVSDGEEVYFNGTDPTDGLPYYRDEDGDGLSAWEEGLLGTSDLLLDSDNDGISDFEEIKVQNVYLAQFGLPGFDPTDPLDGQADWDLDGVTNADEIAAETDYLNMDGDGDGIANFAELKLGTDPLAAHDFGNSDLDGDGLSTLAERDLATNDLSIDTDGDGLSDYLEGSNESPFASYLNPLDGDDALADLDGDGLSTIYEISIMLNSGGAGSSGEADQFDPVDYHPDNLVQYNYDPHTPGDGNFDPSNEDSNGNGIPDGDDDVDGDGLSASQEYNYRTDPLKKDTDGDDVLDNEDGWARCIDLAPKRIGKRTYAIIKVKEFPETTTYVGGEINNSGHWLIKTHSNIQYAGRSTSPHFYYDGETVTALPEFSGDDRPYRYEKLNEEGYFLRASWHIGKLTQDYSSPGALYRGIELKGEMPFSSSVFTAGFSFYELRGYEYFSSVTNAGTVYSHAYRETSPKPAGIPAPGAEYAGFYRILNMLGTPKAIEPQIAGVAAGDGDGKSGFTYTSESPLQTVRKGDPNDNDPPYVGTPTWVTGGSISNIYTTNAQDLSLAFRTKLDKFWRDSSANTQHGTVTHSLETWDGEKFSTLGLAVDNDQWRDYWPGPSFTQHYVNYSLAAHLNNKNTIILDSGIWLDTKAGLRNDQPVDKTPTYKKITWDPKWGDQPPRNLNTQMQGYASGSSRIWQNGYWLDLEADKLLGNSDYTDIKICDINDHGMLAAQATNAEGKKCAVFLLPVEIVPDYNRDGMIDEADVGQVREDNPWRWWVNDDKDCGDCATVDESNVPGQADGNFSDAMINGVSDLTDFFPVFLNISGALEALPPGEYDYRLRQDDEAINFAEAPELIPDSSPEHDGAGAYWRSVFWAERYKNVPVQQITASGVSLSNSFLDLLKEGRGILLLEYRKASEAPLELEIWKGNQKVTTIAFHARVDSVEKMYRHVNLYKATGTESSQLHDKGEPENYPDDRTNDKAFVMLHGYSARDNGAKNDRIQRGFQSEIFRRLHQVGSKAKYVAVYWNSATGKDYHRSVYQAFKTSPFIGPELAFLAGNEITLAAHSLGNIVASNAICHEGFKPANYLLINAASPIEAYNPGQLENEDRNVMKTAMTEKEWKPYHERFHSPNWHACFPDNDHRNKLKWKGRFGDIGSLTRPFNFYSTGEDVVANPRPGEDDFNLFRKIWKRIAENEEFERHAWVGQEFIKGGTSIAAGIAFERNHGGWQHIGPFGNSPGHKGMGRGDPLNPPGVYSLYTAAESNQRLADGQYTEEHLAQFGLFKRFESPAYDALYAPINDANRNWPDYGGFAWQNPHTQAQGSALASEKDTQWVILATAMPSVSFAVAANNVGNIEGFDMNKNKNGWPNMPERGEFLNDWQHGDFVGDEVAATFTKIVYKKMVSRGRLNE